MSKQWTKRDAFGIAILSIGLTACAAPASPTVSSAEAAASLSSALSAAASTDPMAAYAVKLGSRPKPTETQVREIGLQLAAIQPEMASLKVNHIESWSDMTCGDIWVADPSVNLVERTKSRFAGGDRPPLNDQQAQQIIDAVTTVYCHA